MSSNNLRLFDTKPLPKSFTCYEQIGVKIVFKWKSFFVKKVSEIIVCKMWAIFSSIRVFNVKPIISLFKCSNVVYLVQQIQRSKTTIITTRFSRYQPVREDVIYHYCDVTMGAMASQITSLTVVYSTVYLDADQIKHQSSALLAFVQGTHRSPVNSPQKWPVTRKMFPFDDVIVCIVCSRLAQSRALKSPKSFDQ